MSYQLAKSVNDASGRSKQTLQPSNCIWMAHWQHSACNSSKETGNHNAARGLKPSSKDVLEISKEMETGARAGIGESSKMDLKSFRNEKKHNPLSENVKGSDGMQEFRIKPVFSYDLEHGRSFDCFSRIQVPSMTPGVPTLNETASLERHSSGHDTSEDSPKSLKPHTCDTCALNLSSFRRDWLMKMQKRSGTGLFPSECTASEKLETKGIHNYCYTVSQLQNCAHDMETGGTYTTLDSVEQKACGFSKFPGTTHRLLIRKSNPPSLLRDDGNSRSTMVTKINGNPTRDIHHLSAFSHLCTRGVILQSLSSSMDSDEEEHVGKVKESPVNIMNRLSAGRERMETDLFEDKNSKLGAYSTVSTKVFNMDLNSPPPARTIATYSREVGDQLMYVMPDSRSVLLGARSPSHHVCPSPSNLMQHAEQPEPRSLNAMNDTNADPGNRSIKRLKLTSNSFQGTKSSGMAEGTSHEMDKYFRIFFTSSIKSSETSPLNQHVEESPLPDRSENLVAGEENKGKGLPLSDAWIKRWLSNRSRNSDKKPETVVICDTQKNRFPSIAAVALMRKAMFGEPYELQKRGTLSVWNTRLSDTD